MKRPVFFELEWGFTLYLFGNKVLISVIKWNTTVVNLLFNNVVWSYGVLGENKKSTNLNI